MRALTPASRGRRAAGSAERGSAYLFVLLALLVLTAIGLSLVVITQTEVQIGGAEKSAQRVLLTADSGVRMQFALSRFNATKPRELVIADSTVGDVEFTESVELSAFYPIYSGPCALCSVNWGEERYWAINYATNSQAQRFGVYDGATTAQALKRLSAMFFIQPERDRRVDESIRTYDPSITAEDPDTKGLELIKY